MLGDKHHQHIDCTRRKWSLMELLLQESAWGNSKYCGSCYRSHATNAWILKKKTAKKWTRASRRSYQKNKTKNKKTYILSFPAFHWASSRQTTTDKIFHPKSIHPSTHAALSICYLITSCQLLPTRIRAKNNIWRIYIWYCPWIFVV